MTALRVETLKRYGMMESLADTIPDTSAREEAVHRLAAQWAAVFDANSMLILGRAAEFYDVTDRLDRIRVPVLYVLSRTDALFPPSLAPEVIAALREPAWMPAISRSTASRAISPPVRMPRNGRRCCVNSCAGWT